MSIFEKERFEIWNQSQHPYKHSLQDFSYVHPALPTVNNLEAALNWIVAISYPNHKPQVATTALLPTVGNTLLDYRVVTDDGDGSAAGYRWEQREGEVVASWHKIYDMDWGEATVLGNFLTQTNDTYISKFGQDSVDAAGNIVAGLLSGQFIYGGASINTHLTLYANSGDGLGSPTGFVQLGDNFRPITNGTLSIGTATNKFLDMFLSGVANIDTMTIGTGSIVDSSGAIDFSNNNLTTLGSMDMSELFLRGAGNLKQIVTPANPALTYNKLYVKLDDKLYILNSAGVETRVGLDFTSTNDNRLIRSNGVTGEAIQESGIIVSDTDDVTGVNSITSGTTTISGQNISGSLVNTDMLITPNGTGSVVVPSIKLSTISQNSVYTPDATGKLVARGVSINSLSEIFGATKINVDNLLLDLDTISNTVLNNDLKLAVLGTGNISSSANFHPTVDGTKDLGLSALRWKNLNLSGGLSDGTNTVPLSNLLAFSTALTGVANGHTLFYNSVSGKWEPSAPDAEINHNTISNLALGDDHTQYAFLNGRVGGQSLIGGSGVSENLVLESTSNATKGKLLVKDNLSPFTNASFAGVWNGTDIGGPANIFRNIYLAGEAKGLRLENFTTGTLPVSSANNKGRVVWATDANTIYGDTGVGWTAVGGSAKFTLDVAFDGVTLLQNIDVSATITDARNAIIQLLDNTNGFERMNVSINATTATNVQISTTIPLPVGSYRLIVIE